MKILDAAQIRAWDRASMHAMQIGSLDLMERAATACTAWIASWFAQDTPFLIICGPGNNGGDGLAIARQLLGKGYSVMAFIVMLTDRLSPDCSANLQALQALPGVSVQKLREGDFITDLPAPVVIVDALFGTGLNRPLEGYPAEFVRHLNALPNTKISIDLPTGMFSDGAASPEAEQVQANYTLTFQQYKRAMLHPESGASCGEIQVLPIGLDPQFAAGVDGSWYTLDREFVRRRYRPRQPFSHKGTHGTAFLIGGSYGMIGAVLLAAQAAGRAGAGKVRALIPACGYGVLQTAAPEAMCMTSAERFIDKIEGWESSGGIGIGPGLGQEPATAAAFEAFLKAVAQPIVVDADALNLLAARPELLRLLPTHSIITPHPKELERLFGKTKDSFARAELTRAKAMEHELIIVAKDRYSIVALPDGRCYYNTAGNAGLATGGSGDVLCGIIAGLLAQDYTPEDAAMIGVYLHAAAGDAAVVQTGMEALVAGDIVNYIGAAFLSLR